MNTESEPFVPTAAKLPDGSGFFTNIVMSREEALALPPEKRPLNYRISSSLYHAVFESIGAASMAWEPRPGKEVFNANEASKIATDLCFKIAEEMEKQNGGTSHCAMLDQALSLDELAHQEPVAALWTDKRTRREGDGEYILHGYTPFYDREFSKWRNEPIRLLEIGLNVGASIKMWLQYFTKAKVVGLDIAEFKFGMPIDEDLLHRFSFFKGNAFSPYDLQRFVEAYPEQFDIVIDDGAHSSGSIIMSFSYLWGHVKPGGYYCIEDFRECVNNPDSRTPGYPDQVQFAETLLGRILLGERDIEEAHVSKELLILRKRK